MIQSHVLSNRLSKWIMSLDGCWAHINIATYDRRYLGFLLLLLLLRKEIASESPTTSKKQTTNFRSCSTLAISPICRCHRESPLNRINKNSIETRYHHHNPTQYINKYIYLHPFLITSGTCGGVLDRIHHLDLANVFHTLQALNTHLSLI